MSLRTRIGDAISGRKELKEQIIRQTSNYQYHVNALCSAYENLFAQVRPLINDMKSVFPYGVGRNGARLPMKKTSELELLVNPNASMGWGEFSDAMFATWLTEDELDIWVHKDDGKRKQNVIGYTILPVGSRCVNTDGSYYWLYTLNGETITLTEDEVAVLRFSRNPRNLDKGVSPASAIFVWSQIDDLVSQYQKAFFENGAVPATITIIKAKNKESYEAKREKLERGLSGARNRNKTVYIWRQLLDDGTSGDEMEVKTIQGNNATLAIKDIIDIVNDKLNKAVGVSNFILGDDSSAKYDNAELSDYQFIRRRVWPALMSFWSQFQHELDRITGGLEYAIQFDLELPELTERKRTEAETARIQAESLRDMINDGATPKAACAALGLTDKWVPAAQAIYAEHIDDREWERQNTFRYALEPSRSEQDKSDAQEAIVCCHHDQKAVERTTDADDGDYGYEPVFGVGEEKAKAIYDMLVDYAQNIMANDPNVDVEELVDKLNEILVTDAQDGAIQGADAVQGLLYGKEVAEEIGKAFGNGNYHLSDEFGARLRKRTSALVQNYDETTKKITANVLNKASAEGWSASKLKSELSKAVPKSRAELIARNETVYAVKAGRIEADKFIEQNYGVELDLVWRISDNGACDTCKAMDGTVVKVGEAFPDHAQYEGVDYYWERSSWNDHGETPNAHPNCRCYFDEEVRTK